MIDAELVRRAVVLLEEIRQADPVAAEVLARTWIRCGRNLADHPSIQAVAIDAEQGLYGVSLVGILNGLCGADEDGWGAVAAIVDEDGRLLRFEAIEERLG